jgi:hypothetical protein
MIMDINLLGAMDRLFDRLELLRDVEAFSFGFDHFDCDPKVAPNPLKAIDYIEMRSVDWHPYPILLERIHGKHSRHKANN